MSDAPLSLTYIRALLFAYVPPDPVALDMIPLESREFLSRADSLVAFLLEQHEIQSRNQKQLAEALDLYSKQSGDVLFHQNLQLCLQQVREKKA